MLFKIIAFGVLLIVFILLFLGIGKAVELLRYPKDKRYLHIRLIILSFVISLIFSNSWASAVLIPLIEKFVEIPAIKSFISLIIPMTSIELIFVVLCMFGLNLVFSVFFFTTIFVFRKTVYKNTDYYCDYDSLTGIQKLLHFPWFFVAKFYEHREDKVRLKNQGYSLGLYVKWMKYIALAIWIAEYLLSYIAIIVNFEPLSSFALAVVEFFYLLPMSAFFIFQQIELFFIDSESYKRGSTGTTDISERMVGDIESLIYFYKTEFEESKALLCYQYNIDEFAVYSKDVSGGTDNNQLKKCNEEGILAIIANQLRQSGIETNANYLNAVIDLLNGDSVYVKDNKVGEFTSYYCSFLNYYIAHGHKALIICSDKSMVEKVKNRYVGMLSTSQSGNVLWEIATIDQLSGNDNENIIICTINELLQLDLENAYQQITEDVSFVVFPDAVGLIDLNNIRIELLYSKLRYFPNIKNYIFISDVSNNIIKDRLEQFFHNDKTKINVFENDISKQKCGFMVWKAESHNKLQKELGIGGDASQHIGTALPLAIVAIKNDFPRVFVSRGRDFGDDCFYKNAMPILMKSIYKYLGSRIDVESKIFYDESEIISHEDMKVICVYDEDYNIFNALWRWFKYSGEKGTIIHVISPFYMMREFFADNLNSILDCNNEFMALLNNNTILDNSRKAVLLAMFASLKIPEFEILNIANQYKWDSSNLTDILIAVLETVRNKGEINGIHNYFGFDDEYEFVPLPGKIERIPIVKLLDKQVIDELMDMVSPAVIQIRTGEQYELDVLKGNIFNFYLNEQVIPYKGMYYTIDSISDGIVYASPVTPSLVYDYFTVSDFLFENEELVNPCSDSMYFDFNIRKVDVTRNIYGYIYSANGNSFEQNSNFIDLKRFEKPEVVKLKNVPLLELSINRSVLGDECDKAMLLLSVLFNGLFKTIFPHSYQNIIAVPEQHIESALINRMNLGKAGFHGEELAKLSFPYLNNDQVIASDNTTKLYIIEFSCVEYGMVNVLYKSMPSVLTMIYRYLNWYLKSGRGSYLNFGQSNILSLFAPIPLLNLLSKAVMYIDNRDYNSEQVTEEIKRDPHFYTCTFCGEQSMFAWQFEDGRTMCSYCHEHMLTQKDEITTILNSVKSRMKEFYHISISNEISVRFQSKDAIERAAGKSSNYRILGFYDPKKKELWIERKGPSLAMQSTMSHEMTHAWQYFEIKNMKEFEDHLGAHKTQKKKVLLEGHAVFVQINYLKDVLVETGFAKRIDDEYSRRTDAYGVGYKLFSDYYAMKNGNGQNLTPFEVMKILVKEIINDEEPIKWPEDIAKL